MTAGWRLTIADLPVLAERREGAVEFDLLARTAALDGTPMSFTIMDEVGAWLDEAKTRDDVPNDLIQRFSMRLDFRISEEQDGRTEVRRVQLDCGSVLATADAEFQGHSRKREIWTRSEPTAAWFVRDE